ncbi:MAG: RnfABCDGE type electron transport complex subunit G [Candidatus Omnitrophica bacterium]|nr:RnfABCDGE type electron transport complex subunit G [Candidatus Omnitrophota bacterium]
MPENIKYILTLTIICFIIASLLTGVYLLTRPRILEQKAQEERQALKEVLPEAGYFEPVVRDGRKIYFRAYSSSDKKQILGYAFRAQAQGYSGLIETMAGMNIQGRITGIKILAQKETPGLGAKIEEVKVQKSLWQAIKELFTREQKAYEIPDKPWFCAQFKGKKISELIVVKTLTERNIQAITGATISSEALTDSVREKAKEILRSVQDRPSSR